MVGKIIEWLDNMHGITTKTKRMCYISLDGIGRKFQSVIRHPRETAVM